jgi:LAO/AO transport system kinase
MSAKSDAGTSFVAAAFAHEKQAVSRLISTFEDQRPAAVAERAALIAALRAQPQRRHAHFIGITGTPGSGKSTLLGRLALQLIERQAGLTIAALAVDPSSRVSGGALLGDRTRMRFPPRERRLFFRSQASANELGGLGPSTFQVCRPLACLYDFVFVETVGIGQSEADVRQLADRVYLVLQPLAGDEVQFLKAGIMEVPDAFILNKCDEPSAERSYHQLRGSLWLARPFDAEPVEIFRTSARTGDGIDALAGALLALLATPPRDLGAQEPHFFARWVQEEWGRAGLRFLDAKLGGAAAFVGAHGYDRAQLEFAARAGALGAGGA